MLNLYCHAQHLLPSVRDWCMGGCVTQYKASSTVIQSKAWVSLPVIYDRNGRAYGALYRCSQAASVTARLLSVGLLGCLSTRLMSIVMTVTPCGVLDALSYVAVFLRPSYNLFSVINQLITA